MPNAQYNLKLPMNEPVKNYAPGSAERKELKAELKRLRSSHIDIPCIIGGEEVRTGDLGKCIIPHNHETVIATFHKAGKKEIENAIKAAKRAHEKWAAMDWSDRAAVFLKAADLLAGPYRYLLNASCMLGQSKNAFQAEIDSACELIDFLRFNSYFAQQIFQQQPLHSAPGTWNRMQYRPLEGFVFAVTPFNFTAIAGNLPSAPAIMGNVALWKPASNAVYSAYQVMKLFQDAGLPDGVINFIPSAGADMGPVILESPELGGIHFTGSTEIFQSMWKTIGENIHKYKSYPRIVGETGGKDFVFVHTSADIKSVGTALIRGAFEYQGQKCSAASRAYIPRSLWGDLKDFMISQLETIKMGDVEDFSCFMNAVIDKRAFNRITDYIRKVKSSDEAQIVYGGGADESIGYFIEPTVVLTSNPHFVTMEEEIFGPVLTIYLYEDAEYEETLRLCDATSPYALTGAIFARDRNAVVTADRILINAAGNFYINDKPTGAVVGQQPFGGSRASGTNDKAGSFLNMIRWVNPRTIKENFAPPVSYQYPFMAQDK